MTAAHEAGREVASKVEREAGPLIWVYAPTARMSPSGPHARTESRPVESPRGGRPLRLVVVNDEGLQVFPLPPEGEVVIGRGEQVDVRIDSAQVSRRHARLSLGPGMFVEDLGSANGTQVRESVLREGQRAPISPGDVIQMGGVMAILQQVSSELSKRPRRLWTHEFFEGRLEEECARAEEQGGVFAVLRVRADAGVPAAEVQEAVARVLGHTDTLASDGPRDWEALMLSCPPARAQSVAAALVAELAARKLVVRAGVASFPADGRGTEALMAKASAALRGEKATPEGGEVIVADPQMVRLHELIRRVAAGTLPVLLMGETGTGKEIFAEAVHRASPRAAAPFVRLNCGAFSETLLESELFGHERGAFTGAASSKPGLLETAEGGTVLLDEIGELPMSLQVKLLRVLAQKEVLRIGGLKPRRVDVRFVSATNRDLEADCAAGRFREDLYFRLNGFSLLIPPLRERPAEIEPLARAFLAEASRAMGRRQAPELAADARALMLRYRWPGNVRELRNAMERALLLCTGDEIRAEHLPQEKMRAAFIIPSPRPPAPSPGSLPQIESRDVQGAPGEVDPQRQRILDALQQAGGNQKEAAKLLGISRGTLQSRLDQLGIQRPRKGAR
ncbi:MAG TPA: sigma 54-interacting transcriptional regulator [Myxococcales bacterium]|nr:sigma 54-interacting transcriptional regulator [Myxococcales bacterium]